MSTNPAKILLVDDFPVNLRLLSRILSPQGYQVRKALNGKMAMLSICTNPPDLILLDLDLPEMSGFEFCARCKSDPEIADIPIIFISAFDDLHSKVKAISLGGCDYLTKPFQAAEVLARVQCHLALYQGQRLLQQQKQQLQMENVVLQDEICDRLGLSSSLNTELREAIAQQALSLQYQPIVDLHSGKVLGLEVLSRWHHPQQGQIPPLDYIPVAEATGLINQIGKWTLAQACKDLRQWQHDFPGQPQLFVSVNVSSKQLHYASLVNHVEQILGETQIDASTLKLEVTESAVMKDVNRGLEILHQLKDLGVQICLDDFGTGFSSLSRLYDFPCDMLKIDQSFIQQQKWELVKIIMMLANVLKIDAVAEGIETIEQLEVLQTQMSCMYGQGFLFSHPLSVSQVPQILALPSLLPSDRFSV